MGKLIYSCEGFLTEEERKQLMLQYQKRKGTEYIF